MECMRYCSNDSSKSEKWSEKLPSELCVYHADRDGWQTALLVMLEATHHPNLEPPKMIIHPSLERSPAENTPFRMPMPNAARRHSAQPTKCTSNCPKLSSGTPAATCVRRASCTIDGSPTNQSGKASVSCSCCLSFCPHHPSLLHLLPASRYLSLNLHLLPMHWKVCCDRCCLYGHLLQCTRD